MRKGGDHSAAKPTCLRATFLPISSSSASTAPARMRVNVRRASSRWPCIISQRGLAGMKKMPMPSASAGSAPSPNIQGQPCG